MSDVRDLPMLFLPAWHAGHRVAGVGLEWQSEQQFTTQGCEHSFGSGM